MALRPPTLLTREHDVAGFDCGVASMNEWLKRTALKWQANRGTRVTVLADENGRVKAYHALSMGQVARDAAPKPLARNNPDPLPVLVMGRLAVATEMQGQGFGKDLLLDAFDKACEVGKTVGIAAFVAHALNGEIVPFYAKFGFRPSPQTDDPLVLFKPMKDIAAEIEQANAAALLP
jgi:GNAT superfamily N-acetyltransferase